jgi:threonine aldolase
MFCFSKGLCSPIGSILAGEKKFIRKARRNRKLMGGGMRQTGYIAAACLISLEKMTNRLNEDHKNAKYLAKQLEKMKIFRIIRNRLDINMVFFKLKKRNFNEKKFIYYLKKYKIKINPSSCNEFRFVTHYWITKEKIDFLISIIKKYIKESKIV